MILPAALRYQGQVAQAVQALQSTGAKAPARQTELLSKLMAQIDALQEATDKLDKALAHHAEGDPLAHIECPRWWSLAGFALLGPAVGYLMARLFALPWWSALVALPLSLVMAVVAGLLGLSRVAAGLHYPSDVLAGAALGLGVGVALRESDGG